MRQNIFCFLSNFTRNFPIPVVLPLHKKLIFSLLTYYFIIANIFVQSWIIWATWHTASHQKFFLLSSGLKFVLTKHFPKMQPFANVLQSRCFYKFPDIHKKISVLESLFNKVTGLMACTFLKKETPVQVFSCKYYKIAFLWNIWTPPEYLKMVEEFLRVSNSTWEIFVQKNLQNRKIGKDVL